MQTKGCIPAPPTPQLAHLLVCPHPPRSSLPPALSLPRTALALAHACWADGKHTAAAQGLFLDCHLHVQHLAEQ